MPSRLKQLWSTLRRDFEANDGELRPRTFVSALLVPNRYGAITWLRLYQLFEDRRVPSAVAYRVLLHLHGLEMDRNVEIGPGLFLPHPRGLLFASGTRIGTDCAVYGMVRFLRNDRGPPRIEDGALLGDGARILGPVTVGPGARVGAGSVVTRDVPPEDTVAGSPARPVRGGANGSSRPRHAHDVEGDGGGDGLEIREGRGQPPSDRSKEYTRPEPSCGALTSTSG